MSSTNPTGINPDIPPTSTPTSPFKIPSPKEINPNEKKVEETAIEKLLKCDENLEETESSKRKIEKINDKSEIDSLTQQHNPSKKSKLEPDEEPFDIEAMEGLMQIGEFISVNDIFSYIDEFPPIVESEEIHPKRIIDDHSIDDLLEYKPCDIITEGNIAQGTESFKIHGVMDDLKVFSLIYNLKGRENKPQFEIKLIKYFTNPKDNDSLKTEITTFQLLAFAKSPPEMWDKFDDVLLLDVFNALEKLAKNTFKNGPKSVLTTLQAASDNLYNYLDL